MRHARVQRRGNVRHLVRHLVRSVRRERNLQRQRQPRIDNADLRQRRRPNRVGLHYDTTETTSPQTLVRVQAFIDDIEIDAASKVVRASELWDGTTLSWSGTRLTINDSTRTQPSFTCDPTPGSCGNDNECPASQFCTDNFIFEGLCVDGCRDDTACAATESCVDGDCVVDGTGGGGDTCAASADCSSDLVCGLLSRRCIETCSENLCFLPGFFGCCELTAAENGTATCNASGRCE